MKTLRRGILFLLMSFYAVLPLLAQSPEDRNTEARNTLNAGVKEFKEGNLQAAVDRFSRALQLDPEFIQAELYLASAYASMYTAGQVTAQNQEIGRKAIESFERVLQRRPSSTDAVAGLAKMYVSTGEPGKARDLYLQLTKSSLQDPAAFYSVGALDWTLVMNRANPPSESDKVRLIEEGLQNLDVALALNPQFEEAMTYKNLLLRQKAETTQDPAERTKLTDFWFGKALEARRQNLQAGQTASRAVAPPPPPPPPPLPVAGQRIGVDVAQANLVRSVKPVYPAPARAARIQGVVVLETFIDKTGSVADLRVISGHALLNEAALDAVRQWRYQPMLLNGQPIDVVTTVTVNFVFQ